MSSHLASNYEILVKTEPFLKFKKELFKKFLNKNKGQKEEVLRRKFYKIIDYYLSSKIIDKKTFVKTDISFIIRELDKKFKHKKDGSFLVQGKNVGYIKEGYVHWIRYSSKYDDDELRTFL